MGAWGYEIFQNDSACDVQYRLERELARAAKRTPYPEDRLALLYYLFELMMLRRPNTISAKAWEPAREAIELVMEDLRQLSGSNAHGWKRPEERAEVIRNFLRRYISLIELNDQRVSSPDSGEAQTKSSSETIIPDSWSSYLVKANKKLYFLISEREKEEILSCGILRVRTSVSDSLEGAWRDFHPEMALNNTTPVFVSFCPEEKDVIIRRSDEVQGNYFLEPPISLDRLTFFS